MSDYFAELHGAAMNAANGADFHEVTITNGWGIASGINEAGDNFLRVFECDSAMMSGMNNKMLGQAGTLDAISRNHHDLKLPAGVDTGMIAAGLMDKLTSRSIENAASIEANAAETLLTHYGLSDNAANNIAMRREYGEVVWRLEKSFGDKGAQAFSDKPLQNATVLGNLKNDLGAGKVDDFSFRSAQKTVNGSVQHATIIRDIVRRPGV